jgi:hypothetical protein
MRFSHDVQATVRDSGDTCVVLGDGRVIPPVAGRVGCAAWCDQLDVVDHWRQFLRGPDLYFRHLLDGPDG